MKDKIEKQIDKICEILYETKFEVDCIENEKILEDISLTLVSIEFRTNALFNFAFDKSDEENEDECINN